MTKDSWNLKTAILFAPIFIGLVGCAPNLQLPVSESLGVTQVYQKSYVLHKPQRAATGDPIIQVKDYFVEKRTVAAVTPDQTLIAEICGHQPKQYEAGTSYPVLGVATFGSDKYSVVQATSWVVYIDQNGAIKHGGRIIGSDAHMGLCTAYVTPPNALFKRQTEEKVAVGKGYENFELLFNGIDKNAMTFTYREYSPEGLARAAFYQTLTYDSNAKLIRFKKFKINVIETNSEGIHYSVEEDGR